MSMQGSCLFWLCSSSRLANIGQKVIAHMAILVSFAMLTRQVLKLPQTQDELQLEMITSLQVSGKGEMILPPLRRVGVWTTPPWTVFEHCPGMSRKMRWLHLRLAKAVPPAILTQSLSFFSVKGGLALMDMLSKRHLAPRKVRVKRGLTGTLSEIRRVQRKLGSTGPLRKRKSLLLGKRRGDSVLCSNRRMSYSPGSAVPPQERCSLETRAAIVFSARTVRCRILLGAQFRPKRLGGITVL